MSTQTQTISESESVNVTMTMAEKMAQERWLLNQLALDRLTRATVSVLAAHYKFNAEEALTLLGAHPVKAAAEKEKEKPKKRAPLPWLGVVRGGDMCQALDYKGGLFTQCETRAQGSSQWCVKCAKNGQKYGTVAQRVAQGEAFVDAKGRVPACYATVLANAGFTREDAQSEASARGNPPLPETVFVVRAKKPRAKKPVVAAAAAAPAAAAPRDLNDILDEALEPEVAPAPVPIVEAPVVAAPVVAAAPPKTKKTKAAAAPVDPLKPVAWEFRGTKYGKNALNHVFAVEGDGKFAEVRLGVYDELAKDIVNDEEEEEEDDDNDDDRC
jgi:hypothetical protein